MAAQNHAQMKERNMRSILRTLVLDGEASRTLLCTRTGLTPSTISTLTHELLFEGLIEEVSSLGQENRRGRPPINLRLKGDNHVALGVEISANHVKLGVVNITGEMLSYEKRCAPVSENPERAFSIIREFYKEQADLLKIKNVKLVGLGIAVSGLVDPDQAIGRYSSSLGWTNVNFKDYLMDVGVPFAIDNNVRFMALGERWYGRSGDLGSLIFIQVGLGVGCAILLKELGLLKGDNSNAGELGHCTILPMGSQCKCGKHGCLETLVSENAIVSSYVKRAITRNDSNPYLELEEIVNLAARDDSTAIEVLKEAATYLGIGIGNLINVFDIKRIVLNGNAFILSPLVQDWVRQSVEEHCLSTSTPVEFYTSSFQELQAVIGASTAVFINQLF